MICPTCRRPQLAEWPHDHAYRPLRFTDDGTLDERPLPPSQPPGWIDPDPLHVEPEPVAPRIAYQGWELEPRPTPHWFAWFGLGVCVGILILALVITASNAVDAASQGVSDASSGVDTAAPRPALPGAPQTGVAGSFSGAPAASPETGGTCSPECGAPSPTGGIGTALIGGWATYWPTCADCAAAGPLLRSALGPHWKGQTITVVSDVGQVDLRLVTSCACGDRRGRPTIIDVSLEAFGIVSPSPPGSATDPGFVAVSIEIPPALPRTDADLRMMLEVRGDELFR